MTGALQCDRFNLMTPVGARVWVRRDDGLLYPTITRSAAWILGDGTPVILLYGISGGYHLSRVYHERDFPQLIHPGGPMVGSAP